MHDMERGSEGVSRTATGPRQSAGIPPPNRGRLEPSRVTTQRHGIKFKTVSMEFPDEDAACVWIILNQFGRRNLSLFSRAELALKLEPLLKSKAKVNQATGKSGKGKPLPLNSAKADTRAELAKAAGVSHDTIAKAKVIVAKASEEAKAALRAGETTINAEHKKVTVHVRHDSFKVFSLARSKITAAMQSSRSPNHRKSSPAMNKM